MTTTQPKVVLLAGGFGTRLAEETETKPKPMVEIGGHPILWHIMKHYGFHGFNEFVVALGYKGEAIKKFFVDYQNLHGDLTIDLVRGHMEREDQVHEPWVVHLVQTGHDVMTGGRIRRLRSQLEQQTFMVTYGDGVSNVNLQELLAYHRAHKRLATVTAVRPPARFGGIEFDGDFVSRFIEKSQIGEGWINGGFLVFEPGVFDYLDGDYNSLESDALERLAADRQLVAFRHEGFWQCMDTVRDKQFLERLWSDGHPPWRVWR
ncbi:MAG: glucose-1-phosphate cytidylyltransferase [Gemmatimonadetes bacterium]|nr:glucose-1-phosphate cytidylyltransferase [Gemmatimonadota bacterium]